MKVARRWTTVALVFSAFGPPNAGSRLLAQTMPADYRDPSGSARAGTRTTLDSLVDAAARLTARYADRRAAVADGYRRLGVDFPFMGEHWLNPTVHLRGVIDPARPTLLMYATIGGQPTLLGVGFVTTTVGGAAAPVPGWPDQWHEHSGLFGDESGVDPGRAPEHGTRIWVLHAWTRLENPEGRYAPDNWVLPFFRLQMPPAPDASAEAARALALATGGSTYLRGVLVDAGLVPDSLAATVDSVITSARAHALNVADDARAAGAFRGVHTDRLRETWLTLGVSLRAILGDRVDAFLATPHAHTKAGR